MARLAVELELVAKCGFRIGEVRELPYNDALDYLALHREQMAMQQEQEEEWYREIQGMSST